jgi:hypothetical protein
MPFPRDVHVDLLTITAAAATQQLRGRGQLLLARELAARIDGSGYLYDQQPDPFFAFVDLANANSLRGGPDEAKRYYHYSNSRAGYSATARLDAPKRFNYSDVMAQVVPAAAQLRSEVVATMDAGAWAAARQPFLDLFALSDFAANVGVDVARYHVEGEAGPGGTFALDSRGPQSNGYGALNQGDIPQISVATPGAHRVSLHGHATTSSPTPGEVLSIGVFDGTTLRTTFSVTRTSSDPVSLPVGVERSLFLPGEGTAISVASGPITVRNAGSSAVRFGGTLLIWR